MGHVKNYTMGDVVTLYRRRHGDRVMHPMGYDAFGLPAENAAHPARAATRPRLTRENIAAIRRQMKRMGWSIDWKRELSTAEPEYYRWTQWIFLRLFEAGLAYRKSAAVKWCPVDQTVLANEQVIDGRCERCGSRGRGAHARAVVLQDHRLRRPAAGRPRPTCDWPERVRDDAAQLDRPLARRRGRVSRSTTATSSCRCSRPGPTRSSAPRSSCWRPSIRWRSSWPRGSEHEAAVADYVRHAAARSAVERRRGAREDRRLHRPVRDQPGERRADPGLGRRLRAGRVRHRRDHGRAGPRRARLRVRRRQHGLAIRPVVAPRGGEPPADAAYVGPHRRRGAGQLGRVQRDGRARGRAGDHRPAGGRRPRQGHDRLPAARLAALTPALLGLPDPGRPLRRLRDRGRCPTTSCRSCCPTSRTTPRAGARRWRPPRTGCARPARLRRPGPARDGHDGHVRRLVLVLHALRRSAQRARRRSAARPWTPGCRSTSTSAASSTRSCTCCTRASSPRRCTTWATSASRSRSRTCSPRG